MEFTNIYIREINVDSYKSLKNCDLELKEGLNIVIGPNGAGKSNLLDFIFKHVGEPMEIIAQNVVPDFSFTLVYESDNTNNVLQVSVKADKISEVVREEPSYVLSLNKTENGVTTIEKKDFRVARRIIWGMNKGEDIILNELQFLGFLDKKYITFELPENVDFISKPGRIEIDVAPRYKIIRSSFALFEYLEFEIAALLPLEAQQLSEIKKDTTSLKQQLIDHLDIYLTRKAINEYLKTYTPISKIRFNPNVAVYVNDSAAIVENLFVEFLIDEEWMPWSFLSDGTKRLFYLVSECIATKQGIILVEEPELGIHPHQLQKVLHFLKDQSKNKQVIVSTHSTLSLDILEENELDRIIVTKYDKGTQFHRLSGEETDKAKRYINEVGELSYFWLHSDLEK